MAEPGPAPPDEGAAATGSEVAVPELPITESGACDWPRGTAQRARHSSRRWPRAGRPGRFLPCDWAASRCPAFNWLPPLRGSSPLSHLICCWCRPHTRQRFLLASLPFTHFKPRLFRDVQLDHWPAAPFAPIGFEALPIRPFPAVNWLSYAGRGSDALSAFPIGSAERKGRARHPAASRRLVDPPLNPAPRQEGLVELLFVRSGAATGRAEVPGGPGRDRAAPGGGSGGRGSSGAAPGAGRDSRRRAGPGEERRAGPCPPDRGCRELDARSPRGSAAPGAVGVSVLSGGAPCHVVPGVTEALLWGSMTPPGVRAPVSNPPVWGAGEGATEPPALPRGGLRGSRVPHPPVSAPGAPSRTCLCSGPAAGRG